LAYAVLIALVAAALVAMRIYLQRSFQEKFRQAADTVGGGEQYEKGLTEIVLLDEPGQGSAELPVIPQQMCPSIVKQVSTLETRAGKLLGRADAAEANAVRLEEQANILRNSPTSPDSAGQTQRAIDELMNNAQELRNEATGSREDAEYNNGLVGDYRERYPECFTQENN